MRTEPNLARTHATVTVPLSKALKLLPPQHCEGISVKGGATIDNMFLIKVNAEM
ncbi:Hypothetical protein SMAX5B_007814 [Scophthalmus maximus]|uniref:Uncharacterized protein n=1 Tax=Scophthalmus maximus TaxID=52904 RepID=A0A2U9B280_SCOMX|nr:Hypothetical protein SMAX5B_007814 [Scophthalmus maximus]